MTPPYFYNWQSNAPVLQGAFPPAPNGSCPSTPFMVGPVPSVSPTSPPLFGTPVNPPPWEMAPWLYYKPLPYAYRYPGNGGIYNQSQHQTVNYPGNQVMQSPPVQPAQPPTAQPVPEPVPQAATPLGRDELEPPPVESPEPPPVAEPPAEAAKTGKEPDLPLPTDEYPLTKELVNQWDTALDDPHPFHGNRVPTAFEIARFLEEHPHVTLAGKPREIMTRFAENILSTHRSDADNEYEVERDAILLAIDQGFFYNPDERLMKHVRDIAQRGIGLHGQEKTLATSILRKYDRGIFRPTQQVVDETLKKYPWLKSQQTEAIPTQSGSATETVAHMPPDTPLHRNGPELPMAQTETHPIRGALADQTAPLGNVDIMATGMPGQEQTKDKQTLWNRIRHPLFLRRKKEPVERNELMNLSEPLNGQKLDMVSHA